MIEIKKHCACGSMLSDRAYDEDEARRIVVAWFRDHTGVEHRLVKGWEFRRITARLARQIGQQVSDRPGRKYTINREGKS